MITVLSLLLLVALGLVVASAMNKVPLWPGVFVVVVANLLFLWGR
jgi:hypothetical protein